MPRRALAAVAFDPPMPLARIDKGCASVAAEIATFIPQSRGGSGSLGGVAAVHPLLQQLDRVLSDHGCSPLSPGGMLPLETRS
jgi:hypothetical protein